MKLWHVIAFAALAAIVSVMTACTARTVILKERYDYADRWSAMDAQADRYVAARTIR